MPTATVLLIEDSNHDAALVTAYLQGDTQFALSHVTSLASACEALANGLAVDVVLLDLKLPDSEGLETFATLHDQFPNLPVVILTATGDDECAIEAVQQGAQDFLPKSEVSSTALVRSLRYATERHRGRLAEQRNLLVQRDLNVAREIQKRLLPDEPPRVAGFDIAGRCQEAAAVGGDFFDFIPLSNGRWDLLIADVSSHGVAPALIMVGAQHTLRTAAQMHNDLGEVLNVVNRAVCAHATDAYFVTMMYCRIDPTPRTLNYASAGHPAYVIDAVGNVTELGYEGLPLGVSDDRVYRVDGCVSLRPGDLLLLMTDGVWEAGAANGELFGQQRAFDLVYEHRDKPAAEIVDILVASVQDVCRATEVRDDITVVLMKVE